MSPRSFNKTYLRDPSGMIPNLVGTAYLHPLFAIGSIDWGEMWNQRRTLIAYWGTQNKPSYLQLRFLHDNYDFADILYYSVQKEGRALVGEGILMKVCRKKPKQRAFFLFNDILVYGRVVISGRKVKKHKVYLLKYCFVLY